MVNKIVSILLLLALIGSNFSRHFVFAGFQINNQYISDNLCENRMQPQLHCKGKCYLMKKLKQAEESEKKQAEKNEVKNIEVFILQGAFYLSFILSSMDTESLKVSILCHFRYVSHHIGSIFRPPRIIA